MATLVKQHIADEGIVPAYAAVNASDKFAPGEDTYLEVVNGAGAPINVTIVTPKTVDGLAVADQVVAVANGTRKKIGPFPERLYGNAADDGLVTVNYSSQTTITAGVFQLG